MALSYAEKFVLTLSRGIMKRWGKASHTVGLDFHTCLSVDSYETKENVERVGMRFGETDTRLILPAQVPCRLVCTGE